MEKAPPKRSTHNIIITSIKNIGIYTATELGFLPLSKTWESSGQPRRHQPTACFPCMNLKGRVFLEPSSLPLVDMEAERSQVPCTLNATFPVSACPSLQVSGYYNGTLGRIQKNKSDKQVSVSCLRPEMESQKNSLRGRRLCYCFGGSAAAS